MTFIVMLPISNMFLLSHSTRYAEGAWQRITIQENQTLIYNITMRALDQGKYNLFYNAFFGFKKFR